MREFELHRHPFTYDRCQRRLIDEYDKHKKLVIGFDFDNTIFDTHQLGFDYSEIIDLLRECKAIGFILCLYTSEDDEEMLRLKIQYCEAQGIKPEFINESPLMNGTEKPFFNILLDDRAGLEMAYSMLKYVVEYAKTKVEKETAAFCSNSKILNSDEAKALEEKINRKLDAKKTAT